MILALLELGVLAVVAVYLEFWRSGVRRRQGQAWDRLVAQLQPNGFGSESGPQYYWNADDTATPEERWRSIQGAHGLWAMYENARVMLDMANYAARNGNTVDRELLASLRSDAMQIRVCVLIALSKYAYSQVNESTCVNVSRATAVYAHMVSRMAELLQANGGALIPTTANI